MNERGSLELGKTIDDFIEELNEKKGINNDSLSDAKELATLTKSPVYFGCNENQSEEKIRSCLNDSFKKHVAQKMDIETYAEVLPTGLHKTYCFFKISIKGKVTDIKAYGHYKRVEEEVVRIINLVPQLKPGEVDGKKVNVTYALPILFSIE
ncbi:energy transducer TonB [Urechidicola croceus]|uniref:TonB C-terminal domain-containing protein n=1 Tax=Urechidicola croceus TaxID=1850246 RepID=A0A1D8PAW5_9FLAO|nr:hypothetical protein [Urechidicola croceus]AOW21695.1 hypothetical protein LPB138_13835 [Urechidicola croceus]